MDWQERACGIWSAQIGVPEGLTPLGVVGATPCREALEAIGAAELPFPFDALQVTHVAGNTVLCLPLEPDEALYGLGLQFFKVDQRGRVRYLRANSDPRQDTGETHAPVPFLVSSRGYGILLNTARIVTFHCGSCVRRESSPPHPRDRSRDPQWEATPPSAQIEIVQPGPDVEIFLFAGPTPLDVVRRYNLFQGGGCLPPRWGLGFWHRVHYQHTAEMALAEAQEFREKGYPCDVIGLEPGWQTKSYPCSWEWAADRFPDPAGFLEQMTAEGFRVNLWEHGYLSPASRLYAEMEPLSGSHTVWGGLVPDLTLPEARQLLQAQHDRDHVSMGVSGYKLDECDGSELTGSSWMFPAHTTFPSGFDGEQMRQVFGLLLQTTTEAVFRQQDRRTYGLVRASNAGATSLPYVLYSDLYDHREFVRALCNVGFSGLLWTPEIRSARNAEEWVRRMQVVCFSPLAMLNAWADATKPWSFPEVEGTIRKYLELRMRLMPYLYSAFARYHFDGTPPFRAMALERGGTPDAGWWRNTDDQYMMGDSLLVAPLFAGQTEREVLLPPGDWFDFETGAKYPGGEKLKVTPGLETMPVFVKSGGIIPLMPALSHAPAPGEAVPLEVRHYGDQSGRFSLYEDDGETYAYERGAYRWRLLEVTLNPDGTRQGHWETPSPEEASSYSTVTWNFLGSRE